LASGSFRQRRARARRLPSLLARTTSSGLGGSRNCSKLKFFQLKSSRKAHPVSPRRAAASGPSSQRDRLRLVSRSIPGVLPIRLSTSDARQGGTAQPCTNVGRVRHVQAAGLVQEWGGGISSHRGLRKTRLPPQRPRRGRPMPRGMRPQTFHGLVSLVLALALTLGLILLLRLTPWHWYNLLICWLLAVNAIAFCYYGYDKR